MNPNFVIVPYQICRRHEETHEYAVMEKIYYRYIMLCDIERCINKPISSATVKGSIAALEYVMELHECYFCKVSNEVGDNEQLSFDDIPPNH